MCSIPLLKMIISLKSTVLCFSENDYFKWVNVEDQRVSSLYHIEVDIWFSTSGNHVLLLVH